MSLAEEDYSGREGELADLLSRSRGEDAVVVYISSPKALKRLPESRNIKADLEMERLLRSHFGEGNVRVVER